MQKSLWAGSHFVIPDRAESWPEGPRRVAVSAFGFGGINAHLLLEHGIPQANQEPSAPATSADDEIAIIAYDGKAGPWDNIDKLKGALFGVASETAQTPKHWWGHPRAAEFPGHYIEEISVPLGQFRIPMKELPELLPQQVLMLQVAYAKPTKPHSLMWIWIPKRMILGSSLVLA